MVESRTPEIQRWELGKHEVYLNRYFRSVLDLILLRLLRWQGDSPGLVLSWVDAPEEGAGNRPGRHCFGLNLSMTTTKYLVAYPCWVVTTCLRRLQILGSLPLPCLLLQLSRAESSASLKPENDCIAAMLEVAALLSASAWASLFKRRSEQHKMELREDFCHDDSDVFMLQNVFKAAKANMENKSTPDRKISTYHLPSSRTSLAPTVLQAAPHERPLHGEGIRANSMLRAAMRRHGISVNHLPGNQEEALLRCLVRGFFMNLCIHETIRGVPTLCSITSH